LRGKAFFEMQEYDQAINAFLEALKIDPKYKPSKTEHDKVKKVKEDFLLKETNKYSKLFG